MRGAERQQPAAVAQQLRSHYPDARLLLAADNDRSGTGQTCAAEAATRTGGVPALPTDIGDWNDVYCQQGAEATRVQLRAFSQPPQPSPFDTLSDADLKAMSASEKAELLAEHYGNTGGAAGGEELCRYTRGARQVLPHRQLSREIAALFQKARAILRRRYQQHPDTLKLMVPQMGDPARRLIGF